MSKDTVKPAAAPESTAETPEHTADTGIIGPRPVLPLRDIVVFPHMVVSLLVGRQKSVRALEEVTRGDHTLLLAMQRDASAEDPAADGILSIGTLSNILQLLKLPDGSVKVLVEGLRRVTIRRYVETDSFFKAEATELPDVIGDAVEAEALARTVISKFEAYAKLQKKISSEVLAAVTQCDSFGRVADTVASNVNIKHLQRQEVLETCDVKKRLDKVLGILESEINVLHAERRIRTRVKRQMEKTQREYYLNEQIKAIQKELGDEDSPDDLTELEKRIETTKLSAEAREKASSELRKLNSMSPMSAEATVVRNYLDWLLGIPWVVKSRMRKDLARAEKILDEDHYGLEKVKERFIECLAVQQRTRGLKGPIICLVGPPGAGKTSLGKSIARATGREFVRVALGGVRDEAEIRGHRRTYVGSMPGRIIQSLRRIKYTNPLFLLDEIDKMGMDFRGDPSSALLEVLDPEQNVAFSDHYLEVDYDLSNVMFITTANTLNIPYALLDRMEIIRIAGYTEDEKLEIAKRHLLPKALREHGLKDGELTVSPAIIREITRRYTRESGVRNLEREIAKISRKSVRALVADKKRKHIDISPENLGDFLGVPRYRYGESETEDQVGVATGLAWTEVGGELLTIEAAMIPGKGKMIVTGNLRDVMKESISAASTYVRSRATMFGIAPPLFDRRDIHVHLPEAATPKDGPSAGIGMAVAIVSCLTGIPVLRDVAMTGEVTLRGRVLQIGGLKEKLLAAARGGIRTVLIPEQNAKDLVDIPKSVTSTLTITPVQTMDEVIASSLTRKPEPIDWTEEPLEKPGRTGGNADAKQTSMIAH